MAPGIVFEVLRERRLPQEERTALREGATVALASVVLSLAALGLLAGLRAVAPSTMPDLGAWIDHPHDYLVKHYALVSGAVLAEVALAIALAFLGAAISTRKYRETRILPRDTLWWVFHEAEPGTVPWVSVIATDGMTFDGPLRTQESSGDRSNRYFVIGPPLKLGKPGAQQVAAPGSDRVVMPLDSVDRFYVRYGRRAPTAQAAPQSRRTAWKAWWNASWAVRPRRTG